jgi:hypothetical protein
VSFCEKLPTGHNDNGHSLVHMNLMTTQSQDGWQHREYHMLTIGGVFFGLGFRADDACALEALLRLPIGEFRETTRRGGLANYSCLANLLIAMIHAGGDALDRRGAAHEFVRRRDAYLAASDAWLRSGQDGPGKAWRSRYMTKGQRFLIHAICAAKKIEPPANLNRGDAADWIATHDGHHLYQKDEE